MPHIITQPLLSPFRLTMQDALTFADVSVKGMLSLNVFLRTVMKQGPPIAVGEHPFARSFGLFIARANIRRNPQACAIHAEG